MGKDTVIELEDYPDDMKFWTGDKLFPYMGDCGVIMSFSIRNIGKTYSAFANLRKMVEKGFNVAVSRYDRTELAVSIQDFLRYYEYKDDDGNVVRPYKKLRLGDKNIPMHVYEFENGAKVYFFCIKDSPNLKGLEIVNLKRWFIDEIVPIFYKFQTRKYNEFDYFRELYHTILRQNNDLKVIMSANCKTWENPYCMGWEIPKVKAGHIIKIDRTVYIDGKPYSLKLAVENVKPSKAMRENFIKGEVMMGRSQADIERELSDYSNDPDTFIDSCDNAQDCNIQIKIKGNIYGMYTKNGKNYVKEEKLNLNKDRFLLTPIEYDDEFIFVNSFTKTVEQLLNYNRLRFDKRKTEFNIRLGVFLSHTRKI